MKKLDVLLREKRVEHIERRQPPARTRGFLVEAFSPRPRDHFRQLFKRIARVALGQRCGDDRLEEVVVFGVPHELRNKPKRRHMRVDASEQLRGELAA